MTKQNTTTALKLIAKDDINKAIESIAKRAKGLDADIQLVGLSAMDALAKHGDIGYVNRLYIALGKGHRKAALSSWLLAYGAIVANTEKDKAEKPFVYSKDKTTNLQGASQDPWYDHKPDAAPDEVFDLAKALEQIVKRASGKTLVHGGLLTGIQGLLAVVNGEEADHAEDTEHEPAPEGTPSGE